MTQIRLKNNSKHAVTLITWKKVTRPTSSSLWADFSLLIWLIPKSHFDCIWQVYLPGLAFDTVYSTLYSSELLLLQTFFKETVFQCSSLSCLYLKLKVKFSFELSFHRRIKISFLKDAYNSKMWFENQEFQELGVGKKYTLKSTFLSQWYLSNTH